MLRRRWQRIFIWIVLTFVALSKKDWMLASFITIFVILDLPGLLRKISKARVTASGIEQEHGTVIPFEGLLRVVRAGEGLPSTVVTADHEKALVIADRDFARLAKTSLNYWSVEGEKVTATAGEGHDLQVTFVPRGKFSFYNMKLEAYYFWFFCAVVIVAIFVGWDTLAFLSAMTAYLIFFKLPLVYREVQLSVVGDRIILKDENLREHVLRFADIAAVEKGLFRIKVTAKSGEVLYFPQGFVLLPELIEELAGPLADRK